MAIYHCSIKNIGRSKGKSAVASSAYRSGEKLLDAETGLLHDFSKKSGVVHSEVILCENAPIEYQDREVLWNEVQKKEKAKDSRLAREIEVALPVELNREQQIECVRNYTSLFVEQGMCVDWALHDKSDGNAHAHIMLTTRPIKKNGQWGEKEKKAYVLDERGERIPIIDSSTGEQKVDKQNRKQWKREYVQVNDWNKKERVEEWRNAWASCCNKYLDQEKHIDHRSYERQGVEQIPTKHEGYVARQIEKRGEVSMICEENRRIQEDNLQLNLINKKMAAMKELRRKLVNELKQAREELMKRLENTNRDKASFIESLRKNIQDKPKSDIQKYCENYKKDRPKNDIEKYFESYVKDNKHSKKTNSKDMDWSK